VTDSQLTIIRNDLESTLGRTPRSYEIRDALKKNHGVEMDDSTIRGRFINMGSPLRGGKPISQVKQEDQVKQDIVNVVQQVKEKKEARPLIKYQEEQITVPQELVSYVPEDREFDAYIERDIDKRLAIHYDLGYQTGRYKYPLTQGKQGTGKTFSHAFYAWKKRLPFFLFSCYEDFKLAKLFGDKTIINGTVVFQESLFVKAIQNPSVILFDEVNAISNSNSFDFHALLQNRELFIKDADNGKGRTYRLHPQCRIGFAQNPKSAKYLGGSIKPSNFLGRCTFITYPEFEEKELRAAMQAKFPMLTRDKATEFVKFYLQVIKLIDNAKLPMDISIRQLTNVIDLWIGGLELKDAISDGVASMTEAVSQPQGREAIEKAAMMVFKELLPAPEGNPVTANENEEGI